MSDVSFTTSKCVQAHKTPPNTRHFNRSLEYRALQGFKKADWIAAETSPAASPFLGTTVSFSRQAEGRAVTPPHISRRRSTIASLTTGRVHICFIVQLPFHECLIFQSVQFPAFIQKDRQLVLSKPPTEDYSVSRLCCRYSLGLMSSMLTIRATLVAVSGFGRSIFCWDSSDFFTIVTIFLKGKGTGNVFHLQFTIAKASILGIIFLHRVESIKVTKGQGEKP